MENITEKVGDVEPVREDAHRTPSASEYPIRALVRANARAYPDADMPNGVIIDVRQDGVGYQAMSGYGFELYFQAWEIILNPTPEQIAEERAKAGLPPEAAPRPADGTEAEPSSLVNDLLDALHSIALSAPNRSLSDLDPSHAACIKTAVAAIAKAERKG